MNDPTPARLTSPGAILKRELDARGWTQKDLAEIIGRPPQVITEIVRGTKQITPDTALELAAAFGNAPRFWTNLETEYRLQLARARHQVSPPIERRSRLFRELPIAELIRRHWIKGSDDVAELEKNVCEFLGTQSIDKEAKFVALYRRSSDAPDAALAQRAWVRRIELATATQKVRGKFSSKRLHAALSSFRALACNEGDVAKVPELLGDLGVRFVIVPHLPRTKVDGVAAYGSKGPIIALSLRFDRIDWFWFTLMHEVAHLALGHKDSHLDFLDRREETLGDETEERDANALAGDTLLDPTALARFVSQHRVISKADIEAFATAQHVHPGIVVGRLQFEETIPYSHFRSYLVKVAPYLNPWLDNPQ